MDLKIPESQEEDARGTNRDAIEDANVYTNTVHASLKGYKAAQSSISSSVVIARTWSLLFKAAYRYRCTKDRRLNSNLQHYRLRLGARGGRKFVEM